MKRKVGRPKKVNTEQLTITQLALTMIDQANKIGQLSSVANSYSRAIAELVDGTNKANYELSNKIQALEARCADLEARVATRSDVLDKAENKKEFN